MKWHINRVAALALIAYGTFLCAADKKVAYVQEPDFYIVNQIHKRSALTDNDVKKIKLVKLGMGQYMVPAAAGAYATYKSGTGLYEFLEKMGDYAPTDNKKFWWALAGATGVAFGAYKTLYPRTEQGILEQVKAYVDVWDWLGITQSVPNALWSSSSAIARKNAIYDLILQAQVAVALLSDLNDSKEKTELENRLTGITNVLRAKKPEVWQAATTAMQERETLMAEQDRRENRTIARETRQADLAMKQQAASALWYSKIALGFTAAQNFFDKSLKTLVYMYDNSGKIAGGIVAGVVIPSLAWQGMKAWWNR